MVVSLTASDGDQFSVVHARIVHAEVGSAAVAGAEGAILQVEHGLASRIQNPIRAQVRLDISGSAVQLLKQTGETDDKFITWGHLEVSQVHLKVQVQVVVLDVFFGLVEGAKLLIDGRVLVIKLTSSFGRGVGQVHGGGRVDGFLVILDIRGRS